MFTVTKAFKEALLQHFIYQKLEISYAIHKPFPFFEGLRDKSLITDRMYKESLEACQNMVPVSRVVHNVLTNLERTFDLSLLVVLFSSINLREYPNLVTILRSFRSVGRAYGGWSTAMPTLCAAPADPAEWSSKALPPNQDLPPRLSLLPSPPSRVPCPPSISQPEAPRRQRSVILSEPRSPSARDRPVFIQEGRLSLAANDKFTSKTNDDEDSQEKPSPSPGRLQVIREDSPEPNGPEEAQKVSGAPPNKKGKKIQRSVLSTPKKRHQNKDLLRVSERPEDELGGLHSPELPVTCGEAKGILYKEKMAQGPSEKCIQNEEGAWFTPREFEVAGNRAQSKNWKRSVLCRGQTLGQLLEKGLLLCPSRVGLLEQEEGGSAACGRDTTTGQGGQGPVLTQSLMSSACREGTRGSNQDPGQEKQVGRSPRRDWAQHSGRIGGGGICKGGSRGSIHGSGGGTSPSEPVPFPSGSAGPRSRALGNVQSVDSLESEKQMDCPALPPGWKRQEVIRKSGLSAGKSDVYYFSPSGKKFRSKVELARFLGNTVDLSNFDFRTGRMMPSKLQSHGLQKGPQQK